jgi:4-hydroxybenzoate polyprenyltransferase
VSDLVMLARPKGTLLLLAVPLTGYGFAHWDHRLAAQRPLALVPLLVAWACLSAGSLWLNAALDGDEGGALFARAPKAMSATEATTRPARLVAWGYGALAVAVAFAFAAGVWAGALCAACACLAIAYSHPRTMWKAHPVMGPFVNAAGYGVLSFAAGFSIARVMMTPRSAAAMLLLTVFVVGMCFAAQAYQHDDDARRGYRTLVVTAGPAACLRAAVLCTRATLVGVAALAAAGVYPRAVRLGLPAFALAELTMARWRRDPGGGTAADAAEFATRMLAGGTVLVALATIDALR